MTSWCNSVVAALLLLYMYCPCMRAGCKQVLAALHSCSWAYYCLAQLGLLLLHCTAVQLAMLLSCTAMHGAVVLHMRPCCCLAQLGMMLLCCTAGHAAAQHIWACCCCLAQLSMQCIGGHAAALQKWACCYTTNAHDVCCTAVAYCSGLAMLQRLHAS